MKIGTESEPSKNFDIHDFPTETACNPQLKLKVTKLTTCIQCAHKERFKIRPKPSLA